MTPEIIATIGARFDREMAAHANAARRRVAEALDLTVEQVTDALVRRDEAITIHTELARQNAALRAQVASLTADNEALQRTVAKQSNTILSLKRANEYAAAVSKAQRAEWEASQ